ncbi:hypothetical protein SAICODRAFT_46525, partial [Saitoella complicata NRRL Y-17804]|uniref:uncharacterized protein n=1 Tax=Saitoella complicata (strain BCRC 22490 / CBS 7301 / JCM 7358 / NBRC 10748 / NRRL Y-17804) TaxID=698492 RepID=UPI0008672723
MLLLSTALFAYYSIWILLMPFVDADHPVHALFPPREWAIRIPVVICLLGMTIVGSFLGMVMI